MKKILLLCIMLCYSFLSAQEEKISGEEFNSYVLNVLKNYPTNGSYEYYWPKNGGWAGNTQDLYYENKLFSKGDKNKRSYCCGLTFEVFFLAYKNYCTDKGKKFCISDFDSKKLKKFRGQWFGSDGNRETLKNAIVSNKLGKEIKMEDAIPGDFVQLWRKSGSGHSVVFISWIREDKKIIGLQYWSTQRSTNGVQYNSEFFKNGLKKDELHIARIGKK